MPVPSSFNDLDTVASNNSPPGTESAKGNVDNYLRQAFAFLKQLYSGTVAPAQASVASAATVDLGAQTSPNVIITGTTTITGFGTAADGIVRNVVFSGALTLTHNATSLILPGAANITTAAGDSAAFLSLGSGNWRCIKYLPAGGYLTTAAGLAKAGGTLTGALNEAKGTDIASAPTVNLTTATGNLVDVTGTTTITAITLAEGAERTVRFTAALTLTNGANLVLPGGANITTAAGDFAVFRGYASGVVRCASYTKASGQAVVGSAGSNMVKLNTGNGYGSTATKIRRFTTPVSVLGSDITYSDSSANGSSFTVNVAGVYAVSYSDQFSAATPMGLSLNASSLTTNVLSLAAAEQLANISAPGTDLFGSVSWTGYLTAGSVIRPHTHGVAQGANQGGVNFTIVRVA